MTPHARTNTCTDRREGGNSGLDILHLCTLSTFWKYFESSLLNVTYDLKTEGLNIKPNYVLAFHDFKKPYLQGWPFENQQTLCM